MLTDISARLVTADLMFKSGRPEVVRQALEAVRGDLYRLRRSAGIVVLADCIRDSNNAMVALLAYDKHDLDWSKPETGVGLAGKAAIYGYVLGRCDEIASEKVRKDAEFRRLIDGAKESLAHIPKAVETHDSQSRAPRADRAARHRQSADVPVRLDPSSPAPERSRSANWRSPTSAR